MAKRHYEAELGKLPTTYSAALAADVGPVRAAIAAASGASIIAVGSGGSFTVASLLCNLHEAYTGRVSRASTPLELICNPTLAAESPVFLISAEGKNPDIVEALQRGRRHSSRAIHILTNRQSSPLMTRSRELSGVSAHVFELAEKDGYLATNSLLLDAVVVARAYRELDDEPGSIPASIDDLRLATSSVSQWLEAATPFVPEAVRRGTIIVVYSPLLRPIAADFESKLSEAALLHCQVTDLRSFAHGRHLWLTGRPAECAVIALVEPTLRSLWLEMCKHLPTDVPLRTMEFAGAKPPDLLAGLVAEMFLISDIAKHVGKDPGRPEVPASSRNLYYADLPSLISNPTMSRREPEESKSEVMGARWPWLVRHGSLRRSLENYEGQLAHQVFRGVVFDYDGTLAASGRRDNPPLERVLEEICRLLANDIVVGIASGRGGSIQEQLQKSLPPALWSKIHLGLYNGGWLGTLAEPLQASERTSEFLSHATRIVERLRSIGVPIETVRATHPYQVSVRLRDGVDPATIWFVIADALRQAGLDLSSIVRSKHSVDILGPGVNKSHLVAHMLQQMKLDPYEILTLGDQGAWPGNDYSLLEHRYSLSVDVPSRRLDRGWKLAPQHCRDVDAALWYLERFHTIESGKFKVVLTQRSNGSR